MYKSNSYILNEITPGYGKAGKRPIGYGKIISKDKTKVELSIQNLDLTKGNYKCYFIYLKDKYYGVYVDELAPVIICKECTDEPIGIAVVNDNLPNKAILYGGNDISWNGEFDELINIKENAEELPEVKEVFRPIPIDTTTTVVEPEVNEATEPAEMPEANEATEPAEKPEANEATEPEEMPKANEATEPVEMPEANEATEPAEMPKANEATEPAEMPKANEATEPAEESKENEIPDSDEEPQEKATGGMQESEYDDNKIADLEKTANLEETPKLDEDKEYKPINFNNLNEEPSYEDELTLEMPDFDNDRIENLNITTTKGSKSNVGKVESKQKKNEEEFNEDEYQEIELSDLIERERFKWEIYNNIFLHIGYKKYGFLLYKKQGTKNTVAIPMDEEYLKYSKNKYHFVKVNNEQFDGFMLLEW